MKKALKIIIMLLSFACIALSLFLCVRSFTAEELTTSRIIMTLLIAFALVFALVYCAHGGKKSSAKMYHAFCIINMLALLGCAVNAIFTFITDGGNPVIPIFTVIAFISVAMLALCKDLSRSVAYLFCIINLISSPIIALFAFLSQEPITLTQYDSSGMPLDMLFATLTLAAVMFFATYLKYRDKVARGREV